MSHILSKESPPQLTITYELGDYANPHISPS